MLTLTLAPALTDEQADALAGTLLDDSSYDRVISEDANVYKADGSPLIIFRRRVLHAEDCKAAYASLKDAAATSDNRGMAGGTDFNQDTEGIEKIGTRSKTRYRTQRADGTLSKTQRAKPVQSGIVGYFDRNARYPYCRLTAYNINDPERFKAALPLIKHVDRVFAENVPDRYAAQKAIVERTSPDFYISGTVFTTLTVNLNWQTAVHQDKGDYAPGFGVLTALRAGKFDGCYLVFPKYRIAADMQTGDVCLCDVHEWHGNSPLRPRGTYERLSLVFYYRAAMVECGTAAEELDRVKRRKPGDKIHG